MKILLDENLPRQLKNDFPEYEVFTVRDMKWLGKTNGELLKLMLEEGFSLLITGDKNLQHQQNFLKYPIPVFVLATSRMTYPVLRTLVPEIKEKLSSTPAPGSTIFK